MKRIKRKIVDGWGALFFFLLITLVSQTSVLVFSYLQTKTNDNALIALLILILIVILSSICVFFDALRRKFKVIDPTNKILDATERIAKGDFDVQLNIKKDVSKWNEYDLIMHNVNVMTSELQKIELLKTDFISNVSHEIKTPLAIIQNYVTLLQDKNLTDEEREKYYKTVIIATKKLSALITNILKLNKLENQGLKPDKKTFNLTQSLSECVISFEELIESKNISLNCEFEDVIIYSSQELLETVWNNLLSNAIKFTPTGGSIDVSLKKMGYKAIITVKDNGIGMNKETGKRIFEKFYQGDTSHAQSGNGLGLALVKRIIDILSGQITVESQLGKGSSFTVYLNGVKESNKEG